MTAKFNSLIQSKRIQIMLSQILLTVSLNFSTFSGCNSVQTPRSEKKFFLFFFGHDIWPLGFFSYLELNHGHWTKQLAQ